MSYRVTIYCPDTRLAFDGRTPDRVGIGGGVTIRVRLARALARTGQRVTLVGNVPREERVEGVHYLPLRQVRRIDADVVILTSSAAQPDLTPALDLRIDARLRVGWVHGWPMPGAIHEAGLDYVCAVSNFIREIARDQWGVPRERLFVCFNGVEPRLRRRPWLLRPVRRDPHRLLFSGHPDKGLSAALSVLRMLREKDGRFTLHIFGGDGLYGSPDRPPTAAPGTRFHGTIGQRRLYGELARGSFALNLQEGLEAFGITLLESMAAGCVVLASPVGAYPEIVHHGHDGFLVPGAPGSAETQRRAAELVWDLATHPEAQQYVRRNAMAVPWDMDTLARAWVGHWDWALGRTAAGGGRSFRWADPCPECSGSRLLLADGYHCVACGLYTPDLGARGREPREPG